jgi:cyclic di-GMP phosphodiesterase
MPKEKLKIDISFIGQDNILIYPLYSMGGEKIVEARTVLTSEKIHQILIKHGKYVYYSFADEMDSIPNHRIQSAFNQSKEIMDEIKKNDHINKSSYNNAENLVETIIEDLYKTETSAIKLLKKLNNHDEYTYNHSVNVLLLVSIFATKLKKFTSQEQKSLILGAFLHDIGKVKIDTQLLNKKGKLDISEYQKMKRHPQLGYEIIKEFAIEKKDMILQQTILFHHERYDSKGYYGLPYENLPIFPKIVCICDIFDALTSKRSYREAVLPGIALQTIFNYIYTFFDYELVNNFLNIMGPILNGSKYFYSKYDICMLNTKEIALIMRYGEKNILEPEVIIFGKFTTRDKNIHLEFYKKTEDVVLGNSEDKKMIKILTDEYQVRTIKDRLLEMSLLSLS